MNLKKRHLGLAGIPRPGMSRDYYYRGAHSEIDEVYCSDDEDELPTSTESVVVISLSLVTIRSEQDGVETEKGT